MGAAPSSVESVREYVKDGAVFKGHLMQLNANVALEYKVVREVAAMAPALRRRRQQLGMDEGSEGGLLHLEATCSIVTPGMEELALKDEPMSVAVDVFNGETRVHCRSPTNDDLGGVCLVVKEADYLEKRATVLKKFTKQPTVVEVPDDDQAAPASDARLEFCLVGGDEYWWDGYPPIIVVRPEAPGTIAALEPEPEETHFMGSFFEKDIAVRGLQGE